MNQRDKFDALQELAEEELKAGNFRAYQTLSWQISLLIDEIKNEKKNGSN